jgi:hypothetical protein
MLGRFPLVIDLHVCGEAGQRKREDVLKDGRKYPASACAKNANEAAAAGVLHNVLPCAGRMKAKVTKSEVRSMLKMFLHAKRWALIAAVCISACAISGCIESTFNLASESRLPQGVTIPPGLTRTDVSVTLDYIGISQAKFTLRDKNGKKLATVTGKTKGNPVRLNTTPQGPDPRSRSYQLVIINGVTEIIEDRPYREHENMVQNGRIVALFYVIDDPAVRKELLAGGAGQSHW